MRQKPELETATFGMGCFYCPETIFKKVKGVVSVIPGYSGGHVNAPTYSMVQRGVTGHAEVIQISFDSAMVRFEQLLEIFWHFHDPTTLNRQGGDHGPQFRSVIFYHHEKQKYWAKNTKIDKQLKIQRPVLTEINSLPTFYPAEFKHLDYFNNHFNQPYCQLVIQPKLEELENYFPSFLND
jgi:peptide-methionine (S)-S-oxide reductase